MCALSIEKLKYITDINLEIKEISSLRLAPLIKKVYSVPVGFDQDQQCDCVICKLFGSRNVVPLDDASRGVYEKGRTFCTAKKKFGEKEEEKIYFLAHRIFGKDIITTCSATGQIKHHPINIQKSEVNLDLETKLENILDLLYHYKTQLVLGELQKLLEKDQKTTFRISDVDQVIKDLQKNRFQDKDGFEQEFSLLNSADRNYNLQCEVGKSNPAKNRYRNILPYDHTRVKLVKKKPDADYINANYIFLGNNGNNEDSIQNRVPKLYIATQACIESTREDFWSMIWQEKCQIVVTILNKNDASNERYWPNDGTTEMYGRFTVKNVYQTKHQWYYKRKLVLSHCSHRLIGKNSTPLEVYQYHIHVWNDNTVPESCDFLFGILADIDEQICQLNLTSNNLVEKVCVHCSAGVGRTGTFIAIDMAKDMIKNNDDSKNIDIFKLVSTIRAQRPGLVRNVKQYKFIYYSIKEYIKSKSKKNLVL